MAIDDTCFDASYILVKSLYDYNSRYPIDQWINVIEALFPLNSVMVIHKTIENMTPDEQYIATILDVLRALCDPDRPSSEFETVLPILSGVAKKSILLKKSIDDFKEFETTADGLAFHMRNRILVSRIHKI
jgi:hypothetical protein